jgi:catecholate siderophore receptor
VKKKDLRHRRFSTLATMTACAVTSRLDALAASTPNGVVKDPVPAQLPVRRFHIVAGTLDTALEAYRQQSSVSVKVAIPADQLATFHSGGLQGLYTTEAALRLLLQGTGLNCSFENAGNATVGLQHTDTVDVTAQMPSTVSMGKFTEDLLDTPQTVAVIPDFILHDEQNRTLTDAVRNVPGISIAAGESGAQGDNLTIRGFTARNDIFLDGIRDFGSYYRDSFN